MLLRPNPSSGVPVYLQLVEQVKRGLETGALRAGEPLPGVGLLARELVIHPNTVTRAYCELECEGVVRLHHEAGALRATARGFDEPSRPRPPARLARASSPGTSLLTELSALAGENSRLAARIATEVADRAKRERELASAREVQQRLLPQACPAMPGVDCAGACRPALGVGGDYFDFIPLTDAELVFAVGDVCGKGIPAALLMATLRAYLHGEALHRMSDAAEVVTRLNRLVCESFSANRYATFFYARYDSTSRALEYVNAGHCPPFVFRPRGRRVDVLRLDQGGPVVGLMPACSYTKGRMTLEPGDLVVAFTDGVSEAMNEAGDEWGEEGLTQAIAASRALAARGLVDRIMKDADAFAGSAPQHDDMTLVALRISK